MLYQVARCTVLYLWEKEENNREEEEIAADKNEIEFPRNILEGDRGCLTEDYGYRVGGEECDGHPSSSNLSWKNFGSICIRRCCKGTSKEEYENHDYSDSSFAPTWFMYALMICTDY